MQQGFLDLVSFFCSRVGETPFDQTILYQTFSILFVDCWETTSLCDNLYSFQTLLLHSVLVHVMSMQMSKHMDMYRNVTYMKPDNAPRRSGEASIPSLLPAHAAALPSHHELAFRHDCSCGKLQTFPSYHGRLSIGIFGNMGLAGSMWLDTLDCSLIASSSHTGSILRALPCSRWPK